MIRETILFLTILLTPLLYSQSENIQMLELDGFSLDKAPSNSIFEISENHLIVVWTTYNPGADSLRFSHSHDNGDTWEKSIGILDGDVKDINIERFSSTRIIITYKIFNSFYSLHTDDNGATWSDSSSIGLLTSTNSSSSLFIRNNEAYLLVSRRGYVYYFQSSDGINWGERTTLFTSTNNINSHDIVQIASNNLIFISAENLDGSWQIFSRTNSDLNSDWSERALLFKNHENLTIYNVKVDKDLDGKVWIIYEAKVPIMDDTQSNLYYLMSEDNGLTWNNPKEFTVFFGNDVQHKIAQIDGNLCVIYQSERATEDNITNWTSNIYHAWFGRIGYSEDTATPPYMINVSNEFDDYEGNLFLNVKVKVFDDNLIKTVYLNDNGNNILELFDDGAHHDSAPNDSIYGNILENINANKELILFYVAEDDNNNRTESFLNTFFYTPFEYDGHNFIMQNNRSTLPINEKGMIGKSINASYDGLSVIFSGGFALSGYSGGVLWSNGVLPSSRIEDYLVGTVGMEETNPQAKLYLLENSEPPFAEQWQSWKDAVKLGAKFYDGNGDGVYNPIDLNLNGKWDYGEDRPDLLGDQTVWSVMNDGFAQEWRTFSNVLPQGIEVRQTIFTVNSFQDVYFLRYEITNTGNVYSKFESVYFSFFLDPDLGDYFDDLISTDIEKQSVCIYNDGADDIFGDKSPTSFTMLLQGPQMFVPGISFVDNNGNKVFDEGDIALDSAKSFWGELVGSEITLGALNQGLVSSNVYFQGESNLGDPNDEIQLRNYMEGNDMSGNLIDPCNFEYGIVKEIDCSEVDSRYIFSGDPVSETGWLDAYPADVRYLMNVGPFDLDTIKSQTIIGALVFAKGDNSLNSIEKAREKLIEVRDFYETNFNYEIVGINRDNNLLIKKFDILQNYPNPFNPTTVIKYTIPKKSFVTLKVYDVLGNEVTVLVNEEKPVGNYSVQFNANNLSSGVYFYRIQAGSFVETKKLILLK